MCTVHALRAVAVSALIGLTSTALAGDTLRGYYRVLDALPGGGTSAAAINAHGQTTGSSGGNYDAFLGTPAGNVLNINDEAYEYCVTAGINDAGQVAGYGCFFPSQSCAGRIFRYSPDEGMVDLGTLEGQYGTVSAINNNGDIVGAWRVGSAQNERYHAFLYTDADGLRDLGTLGGWESWARDINDAGQVVGYSWIGSTTHPFIWENGAMRDLGTLGGSGDAVAINNAGVVVGQSWSSATQRPAAFIYTPDSGMLEIPMPPGTYSSSAHALNEAGQVAGSLSTNSGQHRLFIYSEAGGFHDLGTVGDAFNVQVSALNAAGQIIGSFITNMYESKAFIASVELGIVEINTILSPPLAWNVTSAVDINDAGRMVLVGFDVNRNVSAVAWLQRPADMNCDGSVNSFDIQGFVSALQDPDGYTAANPQCEFRNADVNGDGSVNGFDIQGFIDALGG